MFIFARPLRKEQPRAATPGVIEKLRNGGRKPTTTHLAAMRYDVSTERVRAALEGGLPGLGFIRLNWQDGTRGSPRRNQGRYRRARSSPSGSRERASRSNIVHDGVDECAGEPPGGRMIWDGSQPGQLVKRESTRCSRRGRPSPAPARSGSRSSRTRSCATSSNSVARRWWNELLRNQGTDRTHLPAEYGTNGA